MGLTAMHPKERRPAVLFPTHSANTSPDHPFLKHKESLLDLLQIFALTSAEYSVTGPAIIPTRTELRSHQSWIISNCHSQPFFKNQHQQRKDTTESSKRGTIDNTNLQGKTIQPEICEIAN